MSKYYHLAITLSKKIRNFSKMSTPIINTDELRKIFADAAVVFTHNGFPETGRFAFLKSLHFLALKSSFGTDTEISNQFSCHGFNVIENNDYNLMFFHKDALIQQMTIINPQGVLVFKGD